ncbi:beta-ketoacyl-[acyl-carrier-protein] synthase family protein [Streptomyces sp. NPDC002701]|uniref:beta-ketoacyl-[acyl-carrier-protein] synthase family protein n=1 Tax=Streptomyces sp. NPDC002701 TaxID=3364661 RepID=UPI0036A833FD
MSPRRFVLPRRSARESLQDGGRASAPGPLCPLRGSGGTEACLHPFMVAAFAQMKALSRQEGDPAAVSRPFDAARSGFVMAEGAAVLVLERAGFARARGARVHGAVAGASVTSSAGHISASDTEGQVAAVRAALRDAELGPRDIGHVHAHATSTPGGDLAEADAIAKALGEHPVVTATKSMTGHMLGASGAFGAMSALLSLRHGVVPATRNLDELDPRVRLDVVSGENRTRSFRRSRRPARAQRKTRGAPT